MNISLREKLNHLIKTRGEISYGELASFVGEEGYKLSTAERRLRASESPEIQAIMGYSKRNTQYIKAYRYKTPEIVNYPSKKPIEKINTLF